MRVARSGDRAKAGTERWFAYRIWPAGHALRGDRISAFRRSQNRVTFDVARLVRCRSNDIGCRGGRIDRGRPRVETALWSDSASGWHVLVWCLPRSFRRPAPDAHDERLMVGEDRSGVVE